MCVCVCVCVRACVRVCVCVHARVHMQIHVRVHVHTHIYMGEGGRSACEKHLHELAASRTCRKLDHDAAVLSTLGCGAGAGSSQRELRGCN